MRTCVVAFSFYRRMKYVVAVVRYIRACAKRSACGLLDLSRKWMFHGLLCGLLGLPLLSLCFYVYRSSGSLLALQFSCFLLIFCALVLMCIAEPRIRSGQLIGPLAKLFSWFEAVVVSVWPCRVFMWATWIPGPLRGSWKMSSASTVYFAGQLPILGLTSHKDMLYLLVMLIIELPMNAGLPTKYKMPGLLLFGD